MRFTSTQTVEKCQIMQVNYAKVEFLRPSYLAKSNTSSAEVIIHHINKTDLKLKFNYLILLNLHLHLQMNMT